MDYGWVLKRAWEITWKFKGLWVLGILASCSGGGGGGGGGGGSSGTGYQFSGESDPRMLQFQRWIEFDPVRNLDCDCGHRRDRDLCPGVGGARPGRDRPGRFDRRIQPG